MINNIEFVSSTGSYIRDCSQQTRIPVLPFSGQIRVSREEGDVVSMNGQLTSESNFLIEDKSFDLKINGEKVSVLVYGENPKKQIIADYRSFAEKIPERFTLNDFEASIEAQSGISLCHSLKAKQEQIFANGVDVSLVAKLSHSLLKVCRRPRLHLKQINEIRPAAVATRIGTESIRYLASHSEHWKGITPSGLIPDKLLVRVLEDDLALYENIVTKILIDKLFLMFKDYESQTVDCLLQGEVYSVLADAINSAGDRPQEYYKAMRILQKNLVVNDEFQDGLRKYYADIVETLYNLSLCRLTPLYRKLKRFREISQGDLKKTNIFMMDKYYHDVYKLWKCIHRRKEYDNEIEIQPLTTEYGDFCRLMFMFATRFMSFKVVGDDDQVCLENHKIGFLNLHRFGKLFLEVEETQVSSVPAPAFKAKIYLPQKWSIKVDDLYFPADIDLRSLCGGVLQEGYLKYDKKLDKQSINKLIEAAQLKVEQKKRVKFKQNLRQRLTETFDQGEELSQEILFIPWSYQLPDTSEALKECFNVFVDMLKDESFDAVYVLCMTRPMDLGNCREELIEVLTSYGNASKHIDHSSLPIGFIPISINDINSFRRIQKILLKHLICLEGKDLCPVCGEKLYHTNKGLSECYSCGFKIIETKCSHCKKPFVFTRYDLPKIFEKTMDEPGYNVVYDEISLGFLNITNCKKEQKDAPICPYCGES